MSNSDSHCCCCQENIDDESMAAEPIGDELPMHPEGFANDHKLEEDFLA